MEGHNGHGYIQEDGGYDELMGNTAWSAPGNDQFLYAQQGHPQPDLYSRYTTAPQPSYDHFDLSQQPSYPTLNNYSNSPYASQYQQSRPSDMFRQTSSSVDPSLQSSVPYQTQDSSFSVAPNATISPQYLQYAMTSSQNMNRGVPSAGFQQTQQAVNGIGNFNQRPQDHAAIYYNNNAQNGHVQRNVASPIPYPTLPVEARNNEPKHPVVEIKKQMSEAPPNVPRIPQSRQSQPENPLRMTHADLYAANNSSKQFLAHAPYISFEDEPIQITLSLKNTIPKYHPRKARSGRELVPGFDSSRILTPARPSVKKDRTKTPKPASSKWKGTSQGPKPQTAKVASLREDSSLGMSIKSPSTPTETSSSEEETSSEEESEYEEDEMPVQDISTVRGPTRPRDMAGQYRWDAIGIIWKDPHSSPNTDVVKAAIEEYGNFVIALRTKIKSNSKALEDAASRPAEAQRLRTERRDLLDAFYQTINVATDLGYDAIVENLGGHHRLVNGLTTTLIECIKTDDYLGKLPRAVFSLLSKFQTMTDDLLKRLKFESITKRWNKKNDSQINKDITAILANTTDAKERATKVKKDAAQAEQQKKVLDKIDQAKLRAADTSKAPSSNPAKRPHDGDSTNGKPNKKFASDASGTPSATKPLPPKRGNLLGLATKPAPKPVVKKREPSPPTESRLGALLASIAKPPEPPKAPEAPARPPETPEEKARRERKESRRHLRVKFKDGPELEEIRLFKHEQAEDEGRQDNMLRDAHDDRSEGMMLKQRVSIDDEDDARSGEIEDRPYPDLIPIDLSHFERATKWGRKYNTRGGDLTFTTREQEVQKRREGLELMVIYTDPSDIPPTPKEPSSSSIPQFDGIDDSEPERLLRQPTEPWLLQRLQELVQYGSDRAIQIFVRRMQEQGPHNHNRGGVDTFSTSPSTQISSILQQLGGPGQHTSAPHLPAQHNSKPFVMDPVEYQNILRIVESLKGQPYPPVEPPAWMTNEAQRAAWWEGYNRDKALKEKEDAEQRMAQMEAARFQPPPMLTPQYLPPPPQAYQPPPPTMTSAPPTVDMAQQVQGLLASYNIAGNTAAQQPAQQIDYSAWAAVVQAQAQPQAQAQGYSGQEQRWDGAWNDNNNSPSKNGNSQNNSNAKSKTKRGYELKEWAGGKPTKSDPPFDENGEYLGKKRPCRFYAEGKCTKGAKCTFLHD